MKVVALAGGVGGAKLADGLARILSTELTVVVNTGDDFEHLGLKICPDLDTVCYTLAGLANPTTGWGRRDETWHAIEAVATLGGPAWFNLGDRDIGTHLERTRRLRMGQSLSEITQMFCRTWGIEAQVLPVSNEPVPTIVFTGQGELPFQEYFVHQKCNPEVMGFRFEGSAEADPAPGVFDAIQDADLIVICPSNPWVSIDPILAVGSLRACVQQKTVVAVSPIIGGKTVKGPAGKMFTELGFESSALAVARHYGKLLSGFVIDQVDGGEESRIGSSTLQVLVTQTMMRTPEDRQQLAEEVLSFGQKILSDKMDRKDR
jgi:LPPG:FO 2-phospho-L-lactate transferase